MKALTIICETRTDTEDAQVWYRCAEDASLDSYGQAATRRDAVAEARQRLAENIQRFICDGENLSQGSVIIIQP